jgi:hypothetical protein
MINGLIFAVGNGWLVRVARVTTLFLQSTIDNPATVVQSSNLPFFQWSEVGNGQH